jgi:hypothetical protein
MGWQPNALNEAEGTLRRAMSEYRADDVGAYLSKPLLVCQLHQSERILDGKSVAVVGNSGKLLNAKHGEAIDSHDAVIRFNWAPTEGYESQVGTKTTIRISNTHFLKAVTCDEFDSKMSKNYTGWNKDFYFTRENETIIIKRMTPYVNSPEIDARIMKRVEELGGNTMDIFDNRYMMYLAPLLPKTASMGLLGTAMCLANRSEGLGAESIDCFGFNFYEEPEQDRHYYDVMTQSKEEQLGSHSFAAEKIIFKSLEEEGIIKIHE